MYILSTIISHQSYHGDAVKFRSIGGADLAVLFHRVAAAFATGRMANGSTIEASIYRNLVILSAFAKSRSQRFLGATVKG